jgi:hypothetical protein
MQNRLLRQCTTNFYYWIFERHPFETQPIDPPKRDMLMKSEIINPDRTTEPKSCHRLCISNPSSALLNLNGMFT